MRMSSKYIEKKRANTSVLIRKADAFGAVIEAAAREESETDVLRRIDSIPPVAAANVAFLCDGRKCDSCSGECKHTLDVSHAKNFSKRDGAFFENEEPQKDQPVKGRGVFIPDVTVEMIRNAPLEGIEEMLNNGEMYNVPEPTEDNRSLPAGDYISRADAIEAVRKELVCDGRHDTHDKVCRFIADVLLPALPSAEAVSREEVTEIKNNYINEISELLNKIDALSAEATCATCADRAMCIMSDDGKWKACKDYRPSAEAAQGDVISKRFISDAILQKISELNAQGEKAIPIAREFIRFKRFVDGLTPFRTEAVQGEWKEWVASGDFGSHWYEYECSVCGNVQARLTNYCPNCGAKMTKGGDSE